MVPSYGDFNNDDQMDIDAENVYKNSFSLLLGYGNGSYMTEMAYLTGLSPHSVTVGDFTNDFQMNIVFVNANDSAIEIFLRDGDGSFANQTLYSTGYQS